MLNNFKLRDIQCRNSCGLKIFQLNRKMDPIKWLQIVSLVLLLSSITSAHKIIHNPNEVVDLSSVKAECKKLFYNSSNSVYPFFATGGQSFVLIEVAILKQEHGVQVENEVVLKAVCRSLDPGFMEVAWGKEYKNVERTHEYPWNLAKSSMHHMFDLNIILKIHVAKTERIRVTCIKNLTFNGMGNVPSTFSLLLSNEDYKGRAEIRLKLDPERETDVEENADDPQTFPFCATGPLFQFKPVSKNKDVNPARKSSSDKDVSGTDILIAIFLFILVANISICLSVSVMRWCIKLESARRNRQRVITRSTISSSHSLDI